MVELLIVSLDGVSWDILETFFDDDRMPNLAKISQKGTDLDLISTTPPDSGPAWTTFQTGLSPESHGIIDFTRIDEGFEKRVNTLGSVNRSHMWDLLKSRETSYPDAISCHRTGPVCRQRPSYGGY